MVPCRHPTALAECRLRQARPQRTRNSRPESPAGVALGSLNAGGVSVSNGLSPTCTWGEGKMPYAIPGAESAVVEQLVDYTAPRGGTFIG